MYNRLSNEFLERMNYVRENFFEIIPTKELAKSWKGRGDFNSKNVCS